MKTKEFREKLGITQSVLADWMGISRELLAQIELDRRSMPSDAVYRYYPLVRILEGIEKNELDWQSGKPSEPSKEVEFKLLLLNKLINGLTLRKMELEQKMCKWKNLILFKEAARDNPVFSEVVPSKGLEAVASKAGRRWEKEGGLPYIQLCFELQQRTAERDFYRRVLEYHKTGRW